MTKDLKEELIESLVPLTQLHGVVEALRLVKQAIKKDPKLQTFLELIMKKFPQAVSGAEGAQFMDFSTTHFPSLSVSPKRKPPGQR